MASVCPRLGAIRSGWESTEMVKRYAHLYASHLAEDAERIARTALGHKSGHSFQLGVIATVPDPLRGS